MPKECSLSIRGVRQDAHQVHIRGNRPIVAVGINDTIFCAWSGQVLQFLLDRQGSLFLKPVNTCSTSPARRPLRRTLPISFVSLPTSCILDLMPIVSSRSATARKDDPTQFCQQPSQCRCCKSRLGVFHLAHGEQGNLEERILSSRCL